MTDIISRPRCPTTHQSKASSFINGAAAATPLAKRSLIVKKVANKGRDLLINKDPASTVAAKKKFSRDERLIVEETEGFRNGVPKSPGILALNSFAARHDQWDPPTHRFKRLTKGVCGTDARVSANSSVGKQS